MYTVSCARKLSLYRYGSHKPLTCLLHMQHICKQSIVPVGADWQDSLHVQLYNVLMHEQATTQGRESVVLCVRRPKHPALAIDSWHK